MKLWAVFHCNVHFSSIDVDRRPALIRQVYEPLVRLARRYPVAIEAPVATLEVLEGLGFELPAHVGSGYVQAIGPLLSANLNRANLIFGRSGYAARGWRPERWLINEGAVSDGLLDVYAICGIKRVLMDYDAVALAHGGELFTPNYPWETWATRGVAPFYATVTSATRIEWYSTIANQQFQRVVHGEISIGEYIEFVQRWLPRADLMPDMSGAACIYCGDAEVIGFRPGRFAAEPELAGDEWARVEEVIKALAAAGHRLELDAAPSPRTTLRRIGTAATPVIVRKQPKYTLSRWSVSGRGGAVIGATCWWKYKTWEALDDDGRKRLLELFASDWRTHITDERHRTWSDAVRLCEVRDEVTGADVAVTVPTAGEHQRVVHPVRREPAVADGTGPGGRYIRLTTEEVDLVLDARRGLSIVSLRFPRVASEPLLGTVRHGYFRRLDLAADWYSGHLLINDQRSETDLVPWQATHVHQDGIMGGDPHSWKRIRIVDDRVEITQVIPAGTPPRSVRYGFVTLLPDAWWRRLHYVTCNGGGPERHEIDKDFDHGEPVHNVSCRTGVGMTGGWIRLGDEEKFVELRADRGMCAPLGLVSFAQDENGVLARMSLSAVERDDARSTDDRFVAPSMLVYSITAGRR